jgi:hypothetical protein
LNVYRYAGAFVAGMQELDGRGHPKVSSIFKPKTRISIQRNKALTVMPPDAGVSQALYCVFRGDQPRPRLLHNRPVRVLLLLLLQSLLVVVTIVLTTLPQI